MSELISLVMIACDACPAYADTVILQRDAAGYEVVRRSFVGTLTSRVDDSEASAIRGALAADSSAPRLHSIDPELVPGYCPSCRRSYCGKHWSTWTVWDSDMPDWLDSLRGRCPEGHERMLDD